MARDRSMGSVGRAVAVGVADNVVSSGVTARVISTTTITIASRLMTAMRLISRSENFFEVGSVFGGSVADMGILSNLNRIEAH